MTYDGGNRALASVIHSRRSSPVWRRASPPECQKRPRAPTRPPRTITSWIPSLRSRNSSCISGRAAGPMSWRSGNTSCSAATYLPSDKPFSQSQPHPTSLIFVPLYDYSLRLGSFHCLLFKKPSLHHTKGVIRGVFSPLSKSYNRTP